MLLSDYYLYAALGLNSSSGTTSPVYGSSWPMQSYSLANTELSQRISADQTEISGYGQLLSAVSAFQSAMQSWETTASVSSVQANSTDSSVATAAATASAATGTYNVSVSQLAEAQSVTSGAFADPSTSIVGSGTITIQLGQYDSGTNSFAASSTPSVSVSVTNASLNDIAAAINGAGAGVTASVVQDSSGYHLALSSNSTGAANGFSVTVADSDGTNTDTSGLSQIAFDPTAAAGAGQNLTETQAAQDAAYSVDGIAATSATNNGVSVASGLTVNLLQPGSTTVSVTQDSTALTAAAQGFVDAYNTLVGTVNSLTASGGALAGDSTSSQLMSDLQNEMLQSFSGGGSFSSLSDLGITPNTDGTLSLDSTTLQNAFNSDPTGAQGLLNSVAQGFDNLTSPYLNDGQIASATQVVQDDLTSLQSQSDSMQQIGSFVDTWSRNQYASTLSSGYAAALYQSLFGAFASPNSSYPSQGYSMFA